MNYSTKIGQWTGDNDRIWTIILTFENSTWIELEIGDNKEIKCICGNVDKCPGETELNKILDKWL